jgi:hypothetical protein
MGLKALKNVTCCQNSFLSTICYYIKFSYTAESTNVRCRDLTQSQSVPPLGTITLISLDLAEVIEAPSESLLKYNWHPDVLSIDIVGAVPWEEKDKEFSLFTKIKVWNVTKCTFK